MIQCWPVIKHFGGAVGNHAVHHVHRVIGVARHVGIVKGAVGAGAMATVLVCAEVPPWGPPSIPPAVPPIAWNGPPPAFPPPWGFETPGGGIPGGNGDVRSMGPVVVAREPVVGGVPEFVVPFDSDFRTVKIEGTETIDASGSLALLLPAFFLMTVRRRRPTPVYREMLAVCLEEYDGISHDDLVLTKGHDFAADVARGRTALLETVSQTKET